MPRFLSLAVVGAGLTSFAVARPAAVSTATTAADAAEVVASSTASVEPTPTLPFDLKELTEDVAKWMVNITSPTNSTDVDVHEEDNDEDDEDDMDAVSWMNFFLSSPEFRAWLFGTPTNTTNERRRSDAPTDWDWATNKEKLVKEIDLMQKQEEATLMAAKKELVSIQRLADVVKSIPENSTQAEKEMVPEDGMKRMAHDYETPRDELDDKEDEIEDALDALNGPMQAFSNRLEDDSSSPQPLRLRRRGHPDVDQRLQNHEEILDEVDEEAKEPKDAWRTYMTSKEKKKNDKWKAGVAHDMTQMMNHLERPKEAAARQKDKEELKKEQEEWIKEHKERKKEEKEKKKEEKERKKEEKKKEKEEKKAKKEGTSVEPEKETED